MLGKSKALSWAEALRLSSGMGNADLLVAAAFVLFSLIFGAGWWLGARHRVKKIHAVMALVRPWTEERGYQLLPPSTATRWGAGTGGFAVHGHWHDVEFQLAFERSSVDNARYVNARAVPAWLPLGAAFDVRKERLSAEAWSESGLWVIAGPGEVASEVMARRGAIAALVGLPLRTVLGMNIEVIGAKTRDCSITCEGWLTDAEKLDRLLYSLAGLCGHRPA